jgi:hypothetical protein
MLIYHPAFDVYHCIFRMLAVTESVNHMEIDMARLLDFYLLFPSAVASIRLPATLKDIRKLAKSSENIYHDPLNVASTFRDMRQIQEVALKYIAASGLIDKDLFEHGYVARTNLKVPDELMQKVMEFLKERQPLANIILTALAALPLRGLDGLKHRTHLMEYKYDVT